MGREKKNNDKRLNVLISSDLRKRYKKYCIDKEVNLSDKIRELMEKDLKENNAKGN